MSLHLQRQIELLKQKVLEIGAAVEEAIAKAVSAIVNRDVTLAQQVIVADDEIDRMEVSIEEECLKTLALYQPVAADLRFVISVLKINNDLERMGDLAENIAKRAIFLAHCERTEFGDHIRQMAIKAQSMVKRSLDALVHADAALARQVCQDDDEVDDLRKDIQRTIRQRLHDLPDQSECWLSWNSVSKHVERLADMATHVAEDVIYLVEGAIVRHRTQG
jgi:phosphate transport system protein